MRWLTHSCAQNTNAAARGKLRIDICFLFLYDCLINLWGRCRRKFWYQDRQSTTSCERGKNVILLRAQPLLHFVATQQNKVFLLRSFWFYCRGFLVWLARPQARKSPKKSPGTGGRKKAALAPLLAPGAEAAAGTTASAPQAVQLGSGGARHAQ